MIPRLRLREGLRGSLLGHPLGVAEADIDGAANPLFGRHGQVLLDEPLPHTRHRDDRQVRIRLRCIDGRERGRDEREAAGKIGTPRGQLQRDSPTERVPENVDRRAAELVDDELGNPGGMPSRGHVAVTWRRRLAETSEVDRIPVDVRLHRSHEIGPVERGAAKAVDEHGPRRSRCRRWRVAHSKGPRRKEGIGSGPGHGEAHLHRLPVAHRFSPVASIRP